MKQLNFTFDGRDYTLEFTRRTAQRLEQRGFDINAVATKPLTMLPMLFSGAMYMHHPDVSLARCDEIYDALGGKNELVGKMAEMYAEQLNTLLEDNPENVHWTASW